MAGESLDLGLKPEGSIRGPVGNNQARELVGAAGDFQLQVREVIAPGFCGRSD
jgi:hypothetical protein